MDPCSSGSSVASEDPTLLAIKNSLECAPKHVKTNVLRILQRYCINVSTTPETATFDMRKLDKDCIAEIQATLAFTGVPEKKRVAIAITDDFSRDQNGNGQVPTSNRKTARELEACDLHDQMSSVQAAVCKKIKECTKNLIKHKRVYIDRDYGVDDADEDGDLVEVDDAEQSEEPDVEDTEDLHEDVPPEEDTQRGDEEDLDLTCGDEITNINGGGEFNDDRTVPDDDETSVVDDIDEATNVDGIGLEPGQDDTLTIIDDEQSHFEPDDATPMARVHFGDLASVKERFAHYRHLLASTTDFANCSELGLEG